MRLPPQVSAVRRGAINWPVHRDRLGGVLPSVQTSESIICQPGQVLCDCGSNKYACCSSNQCHADTATGLCLCGTGLPK